MLGNDRGCDTDVQDQSVMDLEAGLSGRNSSLRHHGGHHASTSMDATIAVGTWIEAAIEQGFFGKS